MGGGPDKRQLAAADSQAALNAQLAGVAGREQDFKERQQNLVNPFYVQRLNGGLPFYGNLTDATAGNTAQAFAPAHANLERHLSSQSGLPNGFAMQARTDLDAQQGRAFDQGLTGNMFANEQAKQQAAAGLLGQAQIANPTAYYGLGLQGNQSIMQAPLQKPGLGGLFGGIAGGALTAAMA